MNIMIGTDPELFFVDKETNQFVSAYGHVPGTKSDPFPTDFGAVQLDGHAIEFNTYPTSDVEEFVSLLRSGISYCSEIAAEANCNLSFSPVAFFSDDHFNSLPQESKVLGCSPDFNGLTGKINTSPDFIAVRPVRTSSGHVHIGFDCHPEFWHGEGWDVRIGLVQRLGPVLGTLAQSWETPLSVERRHFYGANYSFRPKPYGVELRQLDALWLTDDKWMRSVFHTAQRETFAYLNGEAEQAA